MEFHPEERINKVFLYYDPNRILTPYAIIVGLRFETNFGMEHGLYGIKTGTEFQFVGESLLYFHGRVGGYVDAVGVQFAKC